MKTKPFLLALAFPILASPGAFAADFTWDRGGGVNNWTNAVNWEGDIAPAAGDSLYFAGTATGNTNDFAANTQFNGLTFSAGANSFNLGGAAINLAGNITNASSNDQTISLSLALQQNVVVDTGAVGGLTSGGTTLSGSISGGFALEKTGSGRLVLSQANTFSGGVRISNGTLFASNGSSLGTGTVTLGSVAGTENVVLALNPDIANNIVVGAGTGTRTIQSQSTGLDVTGSVQLLNDLTVTNVDVGHGLGFRGGITGSNTITVSLLAGTTNSVSIHGWASHASFTGDVVVQNGSRFDAGNGGGVMDIGGARLELQNGAVFSFNGGGTVGGLDGVAGSVADMGNSSGTRVLVFGGSGDYAYAGNFTNSGAGTGGLLARLNYGGEKGTQTLSGSSALTGLTTIEAGKLILDYSTNNTTKLNDTAVLQLRSGTLELSGGSHNEVVGSTDIRNGGQANIVRTSGSSTISLGALTSGAVGGAAVSGVVNFSEGNIATTTTANTNGILMGTGGVARFVVGGADWATNDGANNIVALASYDAFVGSGGVNTLNYALTDSGVVTANQGFNTLKISTTTAGQSLALGEQTLNLARSGILFTGDHDYSITTGAAGALTGNIILHHYGDGVLTLGRLSAQSFEHAGTGKTVLTTASTGATTNAQTGFFLDSGVVQFSANNQLMGQGNLRLNSGAFVADTSGGNISLTNDSVSGHRNIALGTDVPNIDVVGGGTLTIGGVISSQAVVSSVLTNSPIIFGSATSDGTIVLAGTNTYDGDTRLDGGRLSINSNSSLGNTANSQVFKVIFSRDSTLNTTASFASNRYTEINGGVTGTFETDASTTLTQSGRIVGAGHLRKAGSGTMTLSAVNTYTGSTTISAGTLLLDATGSIAASTAINLGTVGSQGTLDVTAKSAFAFGAGQTLTGYGLVTIGAGKTVTVAGNLAPGNSTGIISVNGDLELLGTTTTTMELASANGIAGSGFDQVDVSGDLAYDGTLTITSYLGWDLTQPGSYNLFDFASFNGNFTDVSVGSVVLSFDSINTWTATDGGTTYNFTLDDGVLTVVPEPAAWLLTAMGGAIVFAMRRRARMA